MVELTTGAIQGSFPMLWLVRKEEGKQSELKNQLPCGFDTAVHFDVIADCHDVCFFST